jgi:predicted RNA polymerase sigma factor
MPSTCIGPGQYQVQAAIACLHGLAPTFADTEWSQIASLYATLERFTPTPVVRVNRAVAVAQAEGAEQACACSIDSCRPPWIDGTCTGARAASCSSASAGRMTRWHAFDRRSDAHPTRATAASYFAAVA